MTKEPVMDYYDYAVHQIKIGRVRIQDAWDWPYLQGRLFRWACPLGSRNIWKGYFGNDGKYVRENMTGDILLVKAVKDTLGNERLASDEGLTKQIRADKRIPSRIEDVSLENLSVFVEWARKLDKHFGETPPELSKNQIEELVAAQSK